MDPNDGDATVSEDGGSGISRRDAIKKGAIVGGAVVWATPVIQAIGISPAGAQTPSPTVPGGACPGCANCTADATGLRALGITVGGVADGTGGPHCQCVVEANVAVGTIAGADAEVICARADDATCSASTYVAGVEVRLANNVLLRANALGSCVSCGTGSSYVLGLRLVVTTAGGNVEVPLNATGGCNQAVAIATSTNISAEAILLSLRALVTIVANEQTCTNGVLTVNALRVNVAGLEVVAGQSRAGGAGCACTACSPNPTCTPPTLQSQICPTNS